MLSIISVVYAYVCLSSKPKTILESIEESWKVVKRLNLSSIDFLHQLNFFVNQLSFPMDFLCQLSFLITQLSSKTLIFLLTSKYISSCMQQCGKLLIPQSSEKLFGLEELLSFLLEYLYLVNHLQIDVAILMFKL